MGHGLQLLAFKVALPSRVTCYCGRSTAVVDRSVTASTPQGRTLLPGLPVALGIDQRRPDELIPSTSKVAAATESLGACGAGRQLL